jgi:tRNA(Ile2) C34 agmatinyltransferase TiaS
MTLATLPEPLFAPNGADETLDDLVVEVIEDLALRERARCLVCGGELVATGDEDGRCSTCGSSLA